MNSKLLHIIFFLTSGYLLSFSQSNVGLDELVTNIPNRQTISLDGEWHIIIDPYENGYYDYRLKPSNWGYFLNAKPKTKSDLIEYNFDKSPVLKVPGDWNTQMPELYYYEGTVWYKKSFNYNKKAETRVFLYFGAVNYYSIVYLNGEKLGEHEGGFTPFNFEITGKIKEGENFIIVKVDNKRKREGVPTVKTDWWNYGGITRSVNLVEVPGNFIQDYFIQLKKGSTNEIKGWIKINGEQKKQKIHLSIPAANIEQSFKTKENGIAEFTFQANVDLWSPDNPKLYKVIIKNEFDEIADFIGFRNIEVKGQDILLNGKPIFLRGMSVHEEAPYKTGRAYSEIDALTILSWAKELNCNFLRLAHYPHNENIIRMADKVGILLWSEIPVYWVITWDNEETYRNAENQLTENITRDKNRASIIIWSVANETPVSEERNTFLINLVNQARKLDDTRLISAALEKEYPEDRLIPHVNDPFGEYLDVLSFNEYIGWYDGLPEKCDKVNWIIEYDKPIVISEFGAGAKQGFHGDASERWTEEYQEDLYKRTINMLEKIENLRGCTPWILMDFRSPNRVLPGIQDDFNRKGIISEEGKKKKAFYILQEWYKQKEEEYK